MRAGDTPIWGNLHITFHKISRNHAANVVRALPAAGRFRRPRPGRSPNAHEPHELAHRNLRRAVVHWAVFGSARNKPQLCIVYISAWMCSIIPNARAWHIRKTWRKIISLRQETMQVIPTSCLICSQWNYIHRTPVLYLQTNCWNPIFHRKISPPYTPAQRATMGVLFFRNAMAMQWEPQKSRSSGDSPCSGLDSEWWRMPTNYCEEWWYNGERKCDHMWPITIV